MARVGRPGMHDGRWVHGENQVGRGRRRLSLGTYQYQGRVTDRGHSDRHAGHDVSGAVGGQGGRRSTGDTTPVDVDLLPGTAPGRGASPAAARLPPGVADALDPP